MGRILVVRTKESAMHIASAYAKSKKAGVALARRFGLAVRKVGSKYRAQDNRGSRFILVPDTGMYGWRWIKEQ